MIPAMKMLARAAASALIAGGIVLSLAPAHAQDPAPAPLRFVASLPGPLAGGATQHTLPGDLMAKKSRGDRSLGKESLVDMVKTLNRLKDKGRSIGGAVVIKGKVHVVKGLPTITSDGNVKVRVAQARGSRVLTIPRMQSTRYYTAVCPEGYYCADYTPSGSPICEPW